MALRFRHLALVSLIAAAAPACGDDSSTGSAEVPDAGQSDAAADAVADAAADASDVEPDVPEPRVLGVVEMEDLDPSEDVVEVDLVAANTALDIGLDAPLDLMTYNGSFPGPLLEANVGDTVIVNFTNQLDEPTTVHWHGLRVPDEMDGNPRIQDPVQPGETFRYEFVVPEAGTFWYHPHVRAHEQVERGLYGPIIIRDPAEPRALIERVVVVDDILLSGTSIPPFLTSNMEGMHGRLGNVLIGNGEANPAPVGGEFGATQGTVELWRIINPSNARTFSLSLEEGAEWRVVGVDGGRVEPYTTERIQVAVGQRYDLEVIHRDNRAADLTAHVLTLDASDNVIEVPVPVYMVDVAESDAEPEPIAWLPPTHESRTPGRDVTVDFDGVNGTNGIEWTINGEADPPEPIFTFEPGEVVRMRLVNHAGPEHPFHLHGQFFEIVDSGTAETAQPGLKDTVLVPGQSTVEIIAYMDNPGRWMAHCHILEHAALGMMAEILVED